MGFANRIRWTADQDAEIRQVYERREYCGNKRLAFKYGIKPGLVSARAARLGLPPLICAQRRPKSPMAYKPEEVALVHAHLGEPIAQIRARLYRKGYSRSLSSIASLIARHRHSGDWPTLSTMIEDRDRLMTDDICKGLGVNTWTVEIWIKRGLLKVGRITGQNLFVVSRRDLRQFLLAYPSHWDHRLADRWFLLDILCGDAAAAAALHAVA